MIITFRSFFFQLCFYKHKSKCRAESGAKTFAHDRYIKHQSSNGVHFLSHGCLLNIQTTVSKIRNVLWFMHKCSWKCMRQKKKKKSHRVGNKKHFLDALLKRRWLLLGPEFSGWRAPRWSCSSSVTRPTSLMGTSNEVQVFSRSLKISFIHVCVFSLCVRFPECFESVPDIFSTTWPFPSININYSQLLIARTAKCEDLFFFFFFSCNMNPFFKKIFLSAVVRLRNGVSYWRVRSILVRYASVWSRYGC